MSSTRLSKYHCRTVCTKCDWFARPIDSSMHFYYPGFPVEICPACGEDVEEVVGRLRVSEVTNGRWPFKTTTMNYISFRRKGIPEKLPKPPTLERPTAASLKWVLGK